MTDAPRWTGGRLVLATHNPGKVREIAELLSPYDATVVSAGELGFPVPDETADTFEGNALIKARASCAAAGLPALADDSGLEIDALDGQPGIHAADWAETATGRDFGLAMDKAHRLLRERAAPEPWTARFVCVLAMVWPDGREVAFRGRVEGRISWPPRGDNGFGYDPVFVRYDETRTFGELSPAEKQRDDHRADAFAQLSRAVFDAAP